MHSRNQNSALAAKDFAISTREIQSQAFVAVPAVTWDPGCFSVCSAMGHSISKGSSWSKMTVDALAMLYNKQPLTLFYGIVLEVPQSLFITSHWKESSHVST